MNTREEQIELIKKLLKTGVSDDARMVLERQFPEVLESEDERIRGWIVSLIHDGEYSKKEHAMALKAVEYLEKQKENPKSANSISSDCASNAKYKDRWHKVEDSLPDNGREVLAKDKLGNTLLARYDGKGWDVSVYDDEDYRCHNGISKWCEIPFEKQQERHYTKRNALFDKCVEDCDPEVMKSVSDEVDEMLEKEQKLTDEEMKEVLRLEYEKGKSDAIAEIKPAEWSEEDKAYLRNLTDYFECNDILAYTTREVIAWLKSLRPQPHWKPSEFVEGAQMDDGYENIGVGEIVDAIDGSEHLKKFVFTDKKDIVGFRGDSGRWDVGDRVKIYIKKIETKKGL